MRNLAVDIGNTAIKYALFEDDRLVYAGQAADEEALAADDRVADIDHLVLSSVRAGASVLPGRLAVKGKVLTISSDTPVPVTNHYETPQTLGADRLAAVIGASFLYPGQDCLVIDAGTCITLDFVDRDKNYQGGSIGLGLEMKFRALHTFTQRLPLVQRTLEHIPLAGRNTAGAIRSGVLNGTVAELNGMIGAYRRDAPGLAVVLCGGDAAFFETKLKAPIFVVPDLVLIGLNRILNYNNV
jgi:type III pantothenate kinase